MQQKAVSKRFVLHVSCVLTHLDGFFVRWRDDRFSTAIRRGIQETIVNNRVARDLRSALRCRLASATKARVIIPRFDFDCGVRDTEFHGKAISILQYRPFADSSTLLDFLHLECT